MNIYSIIPLAAAIIYILLTGVIMAHRPWRRQHKLFAGFVAGAFLWSIFDVLFRSAYLADHKLLLAKLTLISFTLMLLPFCYFVTTFYERRRDNWLVLAGISVFATTTLALLGYQPASIQTLGQTIYPIYNVPLLLVSTAFPFLILAGRAVYFLFRRLILAENALIHVQVTYLILTVIILTLSAVSNIFAIGRQLPISHIGNLLAALLLGYGIIRHQLVDLKSIAWQGLVYGGITVAMALSYIVLLYIFQPWFHSQFGALSILFILGLALLMALGLYPLRKILQSGVERLLYPVTYNYRKTLLEFSKRASHILNIDELGQELTQLVANAVGAEKAYLLLSDNDSGDLKTKYVVPQTDDDTPIDRFVVKADNPIIECLLREEKPIFHEALNIMPEFRSLWRKEKATYKEIEAELFVPLISRGSLVGLMVLSRKKPLGAYSMNDIELLSVLSHETAIAIENAQLHARIEGQAITDDMTKLFNRRHFDERLNEELSRERRHGRKFSLAIIDIDGFKNYNDTQGHLAGDNMLAHIGHLLKTSVRNIDMVFRYGGDEFALLMPNTLKENARIIAERFRQKVAEEANDEAIQLSVSVGIASWPDDGKLYSELVKTADSALYNAKREGGNCISVFPSMVTTQSWINQAEEIIEKEAIGSINALMAAIEAKDRSTYEHAYKVAGLSQHFAQALDLTKENIKSINMSAMLHDVGKLGIPDELLNERGALDNEQWDIIRTHSRTGANILSKVPILSECIPAVLYHHERYDGTGYPEGKKGESIPFEARIIAIVDAFVSMTSIQPYRDALSYENAIKQLRNGAGKQFDPRLVKVFIKVAKLTSLDVRQAKKGKSRTAEIRKSPSSEIDRLKRQR